jgi:hypothetical protein
MISIRGGFKTLQNLAITWLVFFMPFLCLSYAQTKSSEIIDMISMWGGFKILQNLNKIEVL